MKKIIFIPFFLLSVFAFAQENPIPATESVETEVPSQEITAPIEEPSETIEKTISLCEMVACFFNKGNYIQFPGNYDIYKAYLPKTVINSIQASSYSIKIISSLPRWDLQFDISSYNITIDEFNNLIITKN